MKIENYLLSVNLCTDICLSAYVQTHTCPIKYVKVIFLGHKVHFFHRCKVINDGLFLCLFLFIPSYSLPHCKRWLRNSAHFHVQLIHAKELHENANITFMNSNIMWLPLHPTNIRPDHAICFGQWNMDKYNVCHISEALKGTVSLQGSDLCLLSQMTAFSR